MKSAMIVKLNSRDEELLQKRLSSGAFESAEDVHRALESLDADEAWMRESRLPSMRKLRAAYLNWTQVRVFPESVLRQTSANAKRTGCDSSGSEFELIHLFRRTLRRYFRNLEVPGR
jgi:hypothetical protein